MQQYYTLASLFLVFLLVAIKCFLFFGSMDMTMTSNSKKASNGPTATASALLHHRQQQEVDAMDVMMQARQHAAPRGGGERKPRPQLEEALSCPRCDSNNTKFCYYNNNKMSQPRYFCKACRRYWTQGGSLRNVPVGGGCRKNKRASSSASLLLPPSSSSTTSFVINGQPQVQISSMAAAEHQQRQDFPNVLPTFMSSLPPLPFKSLALSHLAPAPPLDFDVGTMTSSFLDILKGEFLVHQGNNGFYQPMSSGMEMTPSSAGFDAAMQQNGIGSTLIGGGSASAATHQDQGGQQPTTEVGPANQLEDASVPDPIN